VTEYKASGIMVRVTEVVDVDMAKRKIDQVHQQLVSGEDFAELAKSKSDDVITRNQGGDLGWFPVQAWGAAIGNVLPTLQDGEISEPFQSEIGWHIIKREGRREQDVTEESQRNAAREKIANRKSEDEFEQFIRQLRDEAYVENRLSTS
jgi:peptidyl-prolyl cis-trans isomerase SurA